MTETEGGTLGSRLGASRSCRHPRDESTVSELLGRPEDSPAHLGGIQCQTVTKSRRGVFQWKRGMSSSSSPPLPLHEENGNVMSGWGMEDGGAISIATTV